ncbi:hypothetical protein PJL18_03264 [Paenarthrobacter nicotinovorans]|nr:hypothetical protein [Paenarthrobacter nicotinovorans]
MCGQDIAADERADFGEQLTEPGLARYVLGTDAVDAGVVELKMIVVLRGTHQPGGFLHNNPVADLAETH